MATAADKPNSGQRILSLTHFLPVTCEWHTPSHGNVSSPDEHAAGWRFARRRGHSAMYAGIAALPNAGQGHWHIGGVGRLQTSQGECLKLATLGEDQRATLSAGLKAQHAALPVLLDEADSIGHYEGYCKRELWPLFHYLPPSSYTDSHLAQRHWHSYVTVNQAFADAVISVYQPGDIIWVHDYHLLLVSSMIRKVLPNAAIGFFLHAPFPSSEIFRSLPRRKEILEGVLGANQIGFQTYSYARHFISSCTRVLGLESTPTGVDFRGTYVAINIFPIGVDVALTERYRRSAGVLEKIQRLRELYAGKRIIVGRDRLDPVKGILHKLNAFEKFLERYPEWQNNVVLVQVTTPGQVHLPKLEKSIAEAVSRINGTYGSIEFIPVHHYRQQIDRDEFLALLSIADVALITSIRDGMNTTSYEYVLCQNSDGQNPLILSEFTGTAGSLSAAMLVNPWDYVDVADTIQEALTLSAEDKRTKHQHLYNHVATHTAEHWARSFINELRANLAQRHRGGTTPVLDGDQLYRAFCGARRRLLMFDYDGTLTAIRKTPGAAVPSQEMLDALTALAEDPRNSVWVISGRDQAALENWLGTVPNLGLSAEHGCFIRYPGQEWANLMEQGDLSWKKEVSEIFDYYTERTQGSFIEHKASSITWHYRLADPEFGEFQAKECQNHLENAVLSKLPVEILVGKKNLEVRPVDINKGGVVTRLLAAEEEGCELVVCSGDDKTDEDMFRAVCRDPRLCSPSSAFCITIGSETKKTTAGWHVSSPEKLVDELRRLAGLPAATPGWSRDAQADEGDGDA